MPTNLNTTITIGPGEIADVLHFCFEADLRPIFYGDTGLGKTAGVTKACEQPTWTAPSKTKAWRKHLLSGLTGQEDAIEPEFTAARCIPLHLSHLTSVDVKGMPMPNVEKRIVEWFTAEFFPFEDEGPGWIFLDEIDRADDDVQNAILDVLAKKQIGARRLKDGWNICGAMNGHYANHTHPLGEATCDRVVFVHVVANAAHFVANAREEKFHPVIISYVEKNPDILTVGTQARKEDDDMCAISPRSLEHCSKILTHAAESHRWEHVPLLIQGKIGTVQGAQLMAYHDGLMNGVKVDEIWAAKGASRHPLIPRTFDGLYFLVSGIIGKILDTDDALRALDILCDFEIVAEEKPTMLVVELMTEGFERIMAAAVRKDPKLYRKISRSPVIARYNEITNRAQFETDPFRATSAA